MRHTGTKNLRRGGSAASRDTLCLLVALLVLGVCSRAGGAAAVTQVQVSGADSQIESAFAAVHAAETSGGNASSLDAKLNDAIQLVQDAEAENATDPAQAASDLQNATSIAQGVAAGAPSAGQEGHAARQAVEVTSVGSAALVIVIAALTFVFGGRIHRRAWLRLHRDYVVRPANG